MFNDLPMEGGPCHLPSPPPPGWKEKYQARSKIPGILVTYAKGSPEVTHPCLPAALQVGHTICTKTELRCSSSYELSVLTITQIKIVISRWLTKLPKD
jgi:hypothetical protein